MRAAITIGGLVALAVVVVIGLSQAGGGEEGERTAFDLSQARTELQGAPPQLAGLHAQSSELLEGGKDAFDRRLRALRGRPVVINKWASWCGPCRSEFPYFQQAATRLGKEVAFLGLNSGDELPAARRFMDEFPVPFPSYFDPDEEIARAYEAAKFYPMTIFVSADGEIDSVHPGEYRTLDDLLADVERVR